MSHTHWDRRLTSALDDLREAERHIGTPPHVEAAVLAAWDRAHPPGAGAPTRSWWPRVAAVAAAVVMTGTLVQLGHGLQQAVRPSTTVVGRTDTLLLVGEPILEGEAVRVVRMRIPASTLAELGVRAGSDLAQVDVDVLVGEDGVARAIRVGM